MEENRTYLKILEEHKVENTFNNFRMFLTSVDAVKGKVGVGALKHDHPQLGHWDCALVYYPHPPRSKVPWVKLYSPLFFSEDESEGTPYLIMMAVIANMILDKDPEYEALIAKKTEEYINQFEQYRSAEREKFHAGKKGEGL